MIDDIAIIQFEYKNSEDSLTVLADNDRYSFDVVSSYTSNSLKASGWS